MDSEQEYFRSPELLGTADSVLVVIDVQKKLIPTVQDSERVQWNIGRLIDGARILGVPTLLTEQYPQGLGVTTEALRAKLPEHGTLCFDKTAFSCCEVVGFRAALRQLAAVKILVCGIESHVCVLQTAMDLLADGFRVLVAVDAASARHSIDHETALRRLESEGAVLTTTETSLFEWCQTSSDPSFKAIQNLVKQS